MNIDRMLIWIILGLHLSIFNKVTLVILIVIAIYLGIVIAKCIKELK